MQKNKQIPISIALFVLAGLTWLFPFQLGTSSGNVRTIAISARQYAFDPAVIQVQRGDTVTIHLEALDAVHGFYLDGYDFNLKAEPGHSAQGTFLADRAGKFKFRCSVTCGNLHPFMIGELRVGPNLPLYRAIAALTLAVLGALIWFWPARDGTDVSS